MRTRLITGSILLAVSSVFLYNGMSALYFALLAVAAVLVYELLGLNPIMKDHHIAMGMVLTSTILFFILSLLIPNNTLMISGFFCLIHLFLASELWHGRLMGLDSVFLYGLRCFYIASSILCIFLLRHIDSGLAILLFAFVSIWITDSFAYFGGKLMGKRPFSSYSPNKTIEGTAIGFIAAVIFGIFIAEKLGWTPLFTATLAGLISIIGQIGDLHESMTKRVFNVKDSSKLLPGHGGFYDRLDSSIAAMPFVLFFLECFL